MEDEVSFEMEDEDQGTEGQEGLEQQDDHDEDSGVDTGVEEVPAAASGEEKRRPTGKERARERAANFKTLQQQNAELQRQMQEMARAVAESSRAQQLAAEAHTRAAQGPQKPWRQVVKERMAQAASRVREGDQASIDAYHEEIAAIQEETLARAEQLAQQSARAAAPKPLSPLQVEIQQGAPWITDPRHNAGVQMKVDQLFAQKGIDPKTASDAVFLATVKEAAASYAPLFGLQVNFRKPPSGNPNAVAGAGPRSFGGGGGAAAEVDVSQMPGFMKDFADQLYPNLPPQRRYATYLRNEVNPQLQKRR